jgi:hypothetical protein
VIIQGPFGHVAEGPLDVEGRRRVRATEEHAGPADGSR